VYTVEIKADLGICWIVFVCDKLLQKTKVTYL